MKRYSMRVDDFGRLVARVEEHESPDGEWVRYEDVAALLRRCRRYVLTPGLYVDDEAEYAELVRAIELATEGK